MAATINKKLVSIYFEEIQYMMFQHLAKQQNCNTADVIREALDMSLESVKNKKNDSFVDWKPFSVGGLKCDLNGVDSDWVNKDYQDEMLGGSYDWN